MAGRLLMAVVLSTLEEALVHGLPVLASEGGARHERVRARWVTPPAALSRTGLALAGTVLNSRPRAGD